MSRLDAKVVGECAALVSPIEQAFRSRWRLSTLRKVDAGLCDRLVEQIELYHAALVTGTVTNAREQTEAMARGWRAACAALESPLLPDDSYQVGYDYESGTRVVIAEHRGSVARVQAVKGERVVMVTPDEVARIVGGLGIIAEAKSFFPDAEIISTRTHGEG